jgi:hypothetical protein
MKRKSTKGNAPKSALETSIPAEVKAPLSPGLIDFTSELMVEPVVYLLLRTSGVLDETSVGDFFERVSHSVLASKAKRVLVDLRECKVTLTISDMHDLVKLVAPGFAGVVERLAIVVTKSDILPEKFFEPALTSRGVPTLATVDYDEGLYWLSSKLRPGLS